MNQTRDNRLYLWLLAGLTLVGAWLRLAYLNQPSLWWDEFITVGSALKPLPEMLTVLKYLGPTDCGVELFPPLGHILAHLLLPLGKSDLIMRLPGVISGVATIPVLYLLCRKSLGRNAALLAAMLLALSCFHLHYSREVRPYSLLMLENILALWAIQAGICGKRPRALAVYGLMVLAMLYTSYMASTLIAGQMLWAGLVLAGDWLKRGQARRQGLGLAAWLALFLLLAGIMYLPWVQGQLNVYKLLYDPQARPDFTLDFISRTLKEFAAFDYNGHFPMGWTLAGLGLAGAILALVQGQGRFVCLLGLWTLMPLAGIFLAKAHMELTSRYILPLFFFLIIFAAFFASQVLNWLGNKLFPGPEIPLARLAMGAAALLFLAKPNLDGLTDYYRRETSHYKDLMAYLAGHQNNQDMILFSNPRNMKLIYNWYARGMFTEARSIEGLGYHRAVLLAPAKDGSLARLPGAVFKTSIYDVDIYGLGLVRRGQIPMAPGQDGQFLYRDDFSGFRMLEDIHQAENLAPVPDEKALMPYDAGKAAWGEYHFAARDGHKITGLTLDIQYSVRLPAGLATDAAVTVSLGADGQAPTQVDQVSYLDFLGPNGQPLPPNHEGKRFVTHHLELNALGQVAKTLDLRLDFSPALKSGAIVVEDLSLAADLSGPPDQGGEQVQADLDCLDKSTPVVPWRPGQVLALSQALYGFALDPAIQAPNTAQDLTAYMGEHPQDKPVAELRLADGREALVLFDPGLNNPWLYPGASNSLTMTAAPDTPRTVRSLKIDGPLDRPRLTVGGQTVTLPVVCPAPAQLGVNFQGGARLTFSPLFTQNGLDESGMAKQGAIGRNQDEDCLSCQDSHPCGLTYAVNSAWPITAFRLEAYPRVFGDPDGQDVIKTLYSLDGKIFHPLAEYGGFRGGRWEGWKIPQYTKMVLDKPATALFIRFELSGPKCQLWSSPDAHMRLEADLDASSLLPLSISAWPAKLELEGRPEPGSRFMLLDRPIFDTRAFERSH